jgi:hypothetical protein
MRRMELRLLVGRSGRISADVRPEGTPGPSPRFQFPDWTAVLAAKLSYVDVVRVDYIGSARQTFEASRPVACVRCGSLHERGQSCGCVDNGCQ